ncbi:hypothetical protein [Microbacterium abyssi]|uniref:hypothetical protein n=1 Tax=Microbacterium abyssi TaxID=2782166 RepID=UPI0018891677|nr:hypothetical protein [Microbacterium sp. A18JL241]
MTVTAAGIALRDLIDDRRDAEAVSHELHDAVPFGAARSMIEIEHADVNGSAVDARMLEQVFSDEPYALRPLSVRASPDHGEVMLAIRIVVPARRCPVALSAEFLTSVCA